MKVVIPPAFVYGLGNALVRGTNLLVVPILANILSPADLGGYTLVAVSALLLAQVLNLGGSTAVMREGSLDSGLGYAYALRYSVLPAFLLITALLPLLLVNTLGNDGRLLSLFLFIAANESIQQLFFSLIRCKEMPWLYLVLSLAKAIAWVLFPIYLLTSSGSSSLSFVLNGFSVISAFFTIAYAIASRSPRGQQRIHFFSTLLYSLPMIPHGIAQWIMNSADKVLLHKLHGASVVAEYSVAYAVASVFLVLTSGLATYYPNVIVREYDQWRMKTTRFKFIQKYSVMFFLSYCIIFTMVVIDWAYLGTLRYYSPLFFVTISLVSASFYLLGAYYLYACFFVRNKDTASLAVQTLVTATISLLLLFVLLFLIGPMGAPIATLMSYLFYFICAKHTFRKKYALDELTELSIDAEDCVIASTLVLLMIPMLFAMYYLW